MFESIMGKKKKPSLPAKETRNKLVPTERFNDMVAYYTNELKSRLSEIASLKAENEMLIKTSIKNAARADELRLQLDKLTEELRIQREKLKGR
jgi:hypothetical protein